MTNIILSANTSWYLYNFRRSTLAALKLKGFDVICIAPKDKYSQLLESELGCKWLPLKMDNKGSNPIQDLSLFWQLFKHYKKYKPCAVLHFTIKNNIYGTWAAAFLKTPAINNISGLGTAFLHKGLVPAIARILYKSSFFLASFIFCQNEEDYELLLKVKGVSASKLKCLPGSGVDIKKFSPSLKQEGRCAFTFLFAGRMLVDKGLNELIAAATLLHSKGLVFELVLVGFAGSENASAISEKQLNDWCAEKPYLKFKGSTDQIELEMAEVDCVVLPSYREGMPRTLLEAGAMSIPVITTNVPGCRNIVQHQFNGLLCEVKSVDSLAQAMKLMMQMPAAARNALGFNGMERVRKEFSESIVVDETLSAVKRLTAKNN